MCRRPSAANDTINVPAEMTGSIVEVADGEGAAVGVASVTLAELLVPPPQATSNAPAMTRPTGSRQARYPRRRRPNNLNFHPQLKLGPPHQELQATRRSFLDEPGERLLTDLTLHIDLQAPRGPLKTRVIDNLQGSRCFESR